MITIFDGNTLLQVIGGLGVCVGILGGLSDSVAKLREQEWMCYTGVWTQFFNRLMLVTAGVLCLFVDFPNNHEHPLKMLNWILFPFIGAVIFCLSWCLTFFATVALRAVFLWIIDSLIKK